MRVWFIGAGKFAALCLENLVKYNYINLERVITSLPTRSGRGLKENISQVEKCFYKLNLSAELTRMGLLSQNQELISELNKNAPDIIFVIDFGQIIREPFLSGAKFGCFNIHPSLLPKWRGAAPIQRALLNGDKITGVTVFKLVQAMDAGEILAQKNLEILDNTDAEELYKKLSAIGAEIAADGLKKLENNAAVFTKQNENSATYAKKLERGEFEVNFEMTAEKFHNTVRALNASGGAFMFFKNKRLKIWRTVIIKNKNNNYKSGDFLEIINDGAVFACENSAICLLEVQAEGKNKISGADWARGQRLN